MSHPDLPYVLDWKHNSQPGMCCSLTDDGWVVTKFPGGIPTEEELTAWGVEYDEHKASGRLDDEKDEIEFNSNNFRKMVVKALHDHENRIRALEGKPPVTLKQVISALRKL